MFGGTTPAISREIFSVVIGIHFPLLYTSMSEKYGNVASAPLCLLFLCGPLGFYCHISFKQTLVQNACFPITVPDLQPEAGAHIYTVDPCGKTAMLSDDRLKSQPETYL